MSDLLASDRVFSEEELKLLKEILESMIPAGGNRPAASDERVVDDFMANVSPVLDPVRRCLQRARTQGVASLAESRDSDVRALVALTVQCYYRDDRVLEALGEEPRAPFPTGHDLEEDDWSLLEPVRSRGPIYRRVGGSDGD